MSLAAWPGQAAAQLTACSLQGEYVLSGMMDTGGGPLYVGGLFIFQPPATCTAGVTGTVTIMVVYSPPLVWMVPSVQPAPLVQPVWLAQPDQPARLARPAPLALLVRRASPASPERPG